MSSSTRRLQTPESMTAWILSLGPSERYDKAQQASASRSGSLLNRSLDSTGRQGDTCTADTMHIYDQKHTHVEQQLQEKQLGYILVPR